MTDTLTEQSEPLIVADPETLALPEGQRFFLSDDMFPKDKTDHPVPRFKVKEVADVFFGKSPDWLRWRLRPDDRKVKGPDGEYLRNDDGTFVMEKGDHPEGYFILDGEKMDFKRTEPGARYFTLADIERMAHALAQGGHIDGATLSLVVRMVVTCAKLHGITP